MDVVAPPLSRNDIRSFTNSIRYKLGVDNQLRFPICEFLELLPDMLNDSNFYYMILSDNDLPDNIHAFYTLEENVIYIKESVYNGACADNGRDRMTIAHEIGHALLIKTKGLQLHRDFTNTGTSVCMDPEWQAKCFGGELLIPAHLIKGMEPAEIAEKCKVSLNAATYQLSRI